MEFKMNEQIKQQILNGAYAVTRNGYKAKHVDTCNNSIFPYYFIFLNEKNKIIDSTPMTVNLTIYPSNTDNGLDIIDLWKEPVKPFNLEQALEGEPVLLRNGHKAYIILNLNKVAVDFKIKSPSSYYPLAGIEIVNENLSETGNWTLEGICGNGDIKNPKDIIGMWSEPEKEISNSLVSLPKALSKPQEGMWYITNSGIIYESDYKVGNNAYCSLSLDAGFYFATKEDAQTIVDFLKNNRE